jgi:hypothetical protein
MHTALRHLTKQQRTRLQPHILGRSDGSQLKQRVFTMLTQVPELEAATRVIHAHGHLNQQANRWHLSLPNHPAARAGAS